MTIQATIISAVIIYCVFESVKMILEIRYFAKKDEESVILEEQFRQSVLDSNNQEPAPPTGIVLSPMQVELRDTYAIVYGNGFDSSVRQFFTNWEGLMYTMSLLIQRQMPVTLPIDTPYRDAMKDALSNLPEVRKSLNDVGEAIMGISRSYNIASGEVITYLSLMYPKLFKSDLTVAIQFVIYKDLGIDRLTKGDLNETLPRLTNGDLVLIGRELTEWYSGDNLETIQQEITAELRNRMDSGMFNNTSAAEIRSISVRLSSYSNALINQELEPDPIISGIVDHIDGVLEYYKERVKKINQK
jgi:hypothetical protein